MSKNIRVENLELLAKIIHSKRIALHLSANDLAEQSNVNVRTIEDIELCDRQISSIKESVQLTLVFFLFRF